MGWVRATLSMGATSNVPAMRPVNPLAVLVGLLVAVGVGRVALGGWQPSGDAATWSTIFFAIVLQASPFLALGVVLSALVAAFVSPVVMAKVVPRSPALAVPVGALAGVALPGCECGSVPLAARLISRGAPTGAALAFLLASPAVNPVVLIATAVAFPDDPKMVLGRFLASVLAATVVGSVWYRRAPEALVERARQRTRPTDNWRHAVIDSLEHDLLQAGGWLVVGAITAATIQTLVPRSVLDHLADTGPLTLVILGLVAVALAICSEADAFVAASLTQFSLTSRLVFLTVGPMVDVKLIAMQSGVFGRAFAVRFAPLTFVTAVVSASLVGAVLL